MLDSCPASLTRTIVIAVPARQLSPAEGVDGYRMSTS